MKFLLLLLLIAVLIVMLKPKLRAPGPGASRRSPSPPPVQAVVACTYCGVHLPGNEALRGSRGEPYCSEAHREAGESVAR